MPNAPSVPQETVSQQSAESQRGFLGAIAKVAPTLFVLAVMGGGWLAVHEINTGGQSEVEESVAEEVAIPDSLTLPAGKIKAAKFETVPAQMQVVKHVHTIPGRIRYDETRHVDVKAPMDGILAEVFVTPGEHVESGQLLAVLRSPEIGQARAEILKRQNQREIAEQLFQRELSLAKNLEQMSAMLDQGVSVDEIENAFSNRTLGSYRQGILSSYAKMQLSSELLDMIEPLANSGSVSGRSVRERQAERQMAETEFRTARDQATFAANQAKLNAEAKLSEADRQLNLAWQSVETLLGYKEDRATAVLSNEEALSRLEVRAPFAGSVESRAFANDERVSRGDSLIVLANTDSLYVAASIRESDWSAVSLDQGTAVSVLVPALDDRVFEAQIRYFGREVQADTNSVPLVAKIENSEGLLRPGMFVRVTIPIGDAREALSVKPESVVQHENQSFVFVDEGGGTFKRVDVSTGHVSDDWIEVTNGLQPGLAVVTKGAFLLKSELLLQGEGE
ncbi:efflux RND transporter periplasmic adaptor subunit [Rubripirellula reticaptiva]|uniref:Cobalt-zinc-cadmium resistance protein CzcB n=1 Tax=Rubripirellula reticaptiva TaxID=2528013 RepID=A0A5C6EDF2_9BACT|nr:efflux RND transporter periplasmic adaptor subunit [Rubripirellula reticaptiva]TWU47062.1 Cobalt-zinc-cadmium resistance protein CzcB [Rubripirellula reticaptiva]